MGLIQLCLLSYRPRRHFIFSVVAAEHTFMLAEMHCQNGWSSLLSLLGHSDWGCLQFLFFLCDQSGVIWSASKIPASILLVMDAYGPTKGSVDAVMIPCVT
jgi:hypothetical protein